MPSPEKREVPAWPHRVRPSAASRDPAARRRERRAHAVLLDQPGPASKVQTQTERGLEATGLRLVAGHHAASCSALPRWPQCVARAPLAQEVARP
eukprot:scaffold41262_cov31-Tisochrysis_lutea.AAC.5